jgi:hypothetical protein
MVQQDAGSRPGSPGDVFQFAEVYFAGVVVDRQAKEIRLPMADITGQLQRRLTRRELERVAAFCERSVATKDSPTAVVGGIRRPFASFLLEQVHLVLAGGPREY